MKKDNETTVATPSTLTPEQKTNLIEQLTVEQLGVVEGAGVGAVHRACVEQICDRN